MSTSFPLKKINVLITLLIFLEGFCYLEAAMSANMPINRDDDYTYFLQMAQKNRSQGNYETALLYFDKAIEMIKGKDIANKLFEREAIMEAIESKALVLWNLGQMKEAAECFSEGLLLAQQWKMSLPMKFFETCLKIYELYQEGKNKREKMDFVGAISDFEKAIYMARKLRCPELELKCLRQASLVFFDQNELEQFHLLNERGLRIARLLSHKLEEGRFLNNIALYFLEKRDIINSFSNLNKASVLIEQKGKSQDRADCLYNLGLATSFTGFYDRAIKYFKEALKIDEMDEKIENIILDLNNIGLCLINKGRLYNNKSIIEEALHYLNNALSLTEKSKVFKVRIMTLNNLALGLHLIGEKNKAKFYLNEALTLSKKEKDIYHLIIVNDTFGEIYSSENPNLALKHLSEAKLYLSKIKNFPEKWSVYYNIGRSYENLNELEKALYYYNKSIDIIEDLRKKINYDFYQVGFLRNKEAVYDADIRVKKKIYYEQNNQKNKLELFNSIEKAKGKSFFYIVNNSINNNLNLDSNKYEEEIGDLFYKDYVDSGEKIKFRQIRKEDFKLIKIAEKKQIALSSINQSMFKKLVSIEEIRNYLLDNKTVIFIYHFGENCSIGILLTKDKLEIIDLPHKEKIEEIIIGYIKYISNPPIKNLKNMNIKKIGEKIYEKLVMPFEKDISQETQNLIIIPDSYISCLPLDCLTKEMNGKLDYLLKKYNVIYAPSITSLLALIKKGEEKKEYNNDILAIGYPRFFKIKHSNNRSEAYKKRLDSDEIKLKVDNIPFAKKEIKNIESIFKKSNVDIFMREKASESYVKRALVNRYKIIHFACHGYIDESFPFRSSLILSPEPDKGEDGFLRAHEISELDINAELVVLSACQSAYGPLEKAEGVLSLNRVFFTSGAKAVLSSLWQVNDRSSAELMKYFYRHLKKGMSIARALREAKLEMLKTKFNHPFYWAGFVLSGDGFATLFDQK